MTANPGRAFIGPPFPSLIGRQRQTAPIGRRSLSYSPLEFVIWNSPIAINQPGLSHENATKLSGALSAQFSGSETTGPRCKSVRLGAASLEHR